VSWDRVFFLALVIGVALLAGLTLLITAIA
jgi:hypothetical protein